MVPQTKEPSVLYISLQGAKKQLNFAVSNIEIAPMMTLQLVWRQT